MKQYSGTKLDIAMEGHKTIAGSGPHGGRPYRGATAMKRTLVTILTLVFLSEANAQAPKKPDPYKEGIRDYYNGTCYGSRPYPNRMEKEAALWERGFRDAQQRDRMLLQNVRERVNRTHCGPSMEARGEPDKPAPAKATYMSWWCGKTVVQLQVDYLVESSMGGDEPEPTYTLRFDYPLPQGNDRCRPHFTFKLHQDDEGPLYWAAWLSGKPCERIPN